MTRVRSDRLEFGMTDYSSFGSRRSDTLRMRPWEAVRLRSSPTVVRNRRRIDTSRVSRDRVTGMCEPNDFRATAQLLLRQADRAGEPVVLLILTIDGFGVVRERMGAREAAHASVDAARLVAAAAGPDGLVTRPAGDRFDVLVPGVGSGVEMRFAERLHRLAERFNHLGGRAYVLSFSIGATRREPGGPTDLEGFWQRAREKPVHARRTARAFERIGA
jgi:GGDEF domain-containing protein